MTKQTRQARRHVIDDSELYILPFSSVCTYCAHWQPEHLRRCAAYPVEKSIPVAVWMAEDLHMTPRGDEQTDASGQPIVFQCHPNATALPDELQVALKQRGD